MAYLVWAKKEKLLLKVQEGTGDNLLRADIRNGFVDYVLWSTFRPECLDLDEELPLESVDGGMVMFKKPLQEGNFIRLSLPAAFEQAFGRPYNADACVMLWKERDAT